MSTSSSLTTPAFLTAAMVALTLACGSSKEPDGPADAGLDAGVVGDVVGRGDAPTYADVALSNDAKDAARAEGGGVVLDVALSPDSSVAIDRPQATDAAIFRADSDGPCVDVATDRDPDVQSHPSDVAVTTDVADGPVDSSRDLATSVDSSPMKFDLPPGAQAIPDYKVMPLSDFPYQVFVRRWDEEKYPVLFGLIQSATDFDAYFGAAGVMGPSKPYAPSAEDFSRYSYILVIRAVPAAPVQKTFTVDALMASGGGVGLFYTFKQGDGSATSTMADGMMVAFPKRKIDQLVVYENHIPLGGHP